jgi:hypothetical protein
MKIKSIEESNIDIQTSQNSESYFQLSEIYYQVIRLFISIAVFITIATGAIYGLDQSTEQDNFSKELTWFDSFYFVIVTITTVGKKNNCHHYLRTKILLHYHRVILHDTVNRIW